MSETNPSDTCSLCKVSFKVKFGNLGKQRHSSSENLFKPSQRQDCFGVQLSEICSQVGFPFMQDSLRFSDHVCNPCGRKICNLGQLYEFVKAANASFTGTPIQRSKQTLAAPEKASPSRRKSKSVHVNSPAAKKQAREASPSKSRKSLAFSGEISALFTSFQRHDEMLSRLNIDNLPNDGVKKVYLNLSGNVSVRGPQDSQMKTLIKNIAAEKWHEVSKTIILKHKKNCALTEKWNQQRYFKRIQRVLELKQYFGCAKSRRAGWLLKQVIFRGSENLMSSLGSL